MTQQPCEAMNRRGERCGVMTGYPIGFCHNHIEQLMYGVADMIRQGHMPGELRAVINEIVEQRVRDEVRARMKPSTGDRSKRWVYFAYRDGHIKIGSAVNVRRRMKMLERGGVIMPPNVLAGPVECLGQQAGGVPAERALHRQFAHLHVAGEWFRDTPELRAYITEVSAKATARRAA